MGALSPRSGSPGWVGSGWDEIRKGGAHAIVLQLPKFYLLDTLAEAVRFELTGPFEPPVFKTGAIDHSATLPAGRIVTLF